MSRKVSGERIEGAERVGRENIVAAFDLFFLNFKSEVENSETHNGPWVSHAKPLDWFSVQKNYLGKVFPKKKKTWTGSPP